MLEELFRARPELRDRLLHQGADMKESSEGRDASNKEEGAVVGEQP